MRGVSGSIKSYPITLQKDDTVFIEGDTNDNWERFRNVPLKYRGVHSPSGQMIFDTPTNETIYLMCPIIGCVIPKEYNEYLADIFDPEELSLALEGEEVEDADNTHDFGTERARKKEEVPLPDALRALAKDIENGEMGEVNGAIVIAAHGTVCEYRPIGLTVSQITHALEWCKMCNMGVAFYDTDD